MTPTGLSFTNHAIVSVPTVPAAVKFIANESHIMLSASLVVIVGSPIVNCNCYTAGSSPSLVDAVASQGTPF